MSEKFKIFLSGHPWLMFFLGIIFLAAAGGLGYLSWSLSVERDGLVSDLSALKTEAADLKEQLASTTAQLAAEQETNALFAGQIDEIQGTVSTLDKLAKTDPELLRKYSQVYFLSDNYLPAKLTSIETAYRSDPKKEEQILVQVWPKLKKMIDEAEDDGVDLRVVSGYRSYDRQANLKDGYSFVYGTGANKFSADQGYSEHQLGTTVDLTTEKLGVNFSNFGKDEAFVWLSDNAYRHGFILSYPPNNGYYQYEPWHWRFVGVELATVLHREKKFFYSYPQRTINEYLVKLFD